MSKPIRFIMLGGFLGAGKTTLISQLAKRFQQEGQHVCVVTNDQAAGLVDTGLLKSQGLDVNEVAGSCFCCNFDGLSEAMEEFETRRRPDVILAEPVGSCTDLVATIAIPMMRQFQEKFVHSPYAVVLKPNHGLKILSGEKGGFSEKAEYIFRKQLEESEIILLNRVDEFPAEKLDELTRLVQEQYPGREVIAISAKTGKNLDVLYNALHRTASERSSTMEVDYDIYADGEAELGWLNATVRFVGDVPLSIDSVATVLVESLRESFLEIEAEPGHLKVLCDGGDGATHGHDVSEDNVGNRVAVANLIDSDSGTTLSVESKSASENITAVINARVRLEPEELQRIVEEAILDTAGAFDAESITDSIESFRPGRPVPTHRIQLA